MWVHCPKANHNIRDSEVTANVYYCGFDPKQMKMKLQCDMSPGQASEFKYLGTQCLYYKKP